MFKLERSSIQIASYSIVANEHEKKSLDKISMETNAKKVCLTQNIKFEDSFPCNADVGDMSDKCHNQNTTSQVENGSVNGHLTPSHATTNSNLSKVENVKSSLTKTTRV